MKFVASILTLLVVAKPIESARLSLFRLDPEESAPKQHRVATEFGGGTADYADTQRAFRELFGAFDLSLSVPPGIVLSMPLTESPTSSPATPAPTGVPVVDLVTSSPTILTPPDISELTPEDPETSEAPETPDGVAGSTSNSESSNGGPRLSPAGKGTMIGIFVAAAVLIAGVTVWRRMSSSSSGQSVVSSSDSELASLASAV